MDVSPALDKLVPLWFPRPIPPEAEGIFWFAATTAGIRLDVCSTVAMPGIVSWLREWLVRFVATLPPHVEEFEASFVYVIYEEQRGQPTGRVGRESGVIGAGYGGEPAGPPHGALMPAPALFELMLSSLA